jgi:hypothetical protein
MNTKDFTVTFLVPNAPREVYKTLLDVRSWWTGLYNEDIKGKSDVLNESFTFRAGGGVHYTKQQLIEAVSNKRIVWQVNEASLTFVQNTTEWIGTRICFDIAEKNNQTQITFTHEGLVPAFECYESCSTSWTKYLEERLMKALSVK